VPIHHNLLGAQLISTERIFRPIADEARGAKSCSAYENVVVGGATVPMHRHAVEEIIICLSGTAECTFEGGKPEAYAPGSVVIIPAGKTSYPPEHRLLRVAPAIVLRWAEPGYGMGGIRGECHRVNEQPTTSIDVANSSNRKRTSATAFGCLFFILGALGGCAAGYVWARSQVQMDPSGHVLTGEHRAMMVFARAMVGGLAGGAAASIAALLWRWRRCDRQQSSDGQEE
jgi:hypothetical protein